MVTFLTVTITCSQAWAIIQRISKAIGLNDLQKIELVNEVRKTIPFCPVTIVNDGRNNTR